MRLHTQQFLGQENEYTDWESANYAILPVPYEGGVSFGKGTADAPEQVLQVSEYLEFYDEILKTDPSTAGITTLAASPVSANHAEMQDIIYNHTKSIIASDKFPIILGGDHSISSGVFRALQEKYGILSCIQIDAHADLRDSYEGSKFSHASVMARIREMTSHALQIGIRSMSKEEAEWIDSEHLAVCTMHAFRSGRFDWQTVLHALPDPVYITFDVDAFDWSVVSSTGTPEPGGFTWDEAIKVLYEIFTAKHVVGFDVVELGVSPHDRNSPFAIAKLLYKMIGMHNIARKDLPL
ncbi:agmatinase [candidate division KSB1 bacterium]|nr:agmatinase [candidate division KSB1 bacterium]RQW00161.1 MAG: agmatinase [candidate division KSB1 bacterium]